MKTNLGGGFIDGLGNAFEPLPLYWTDEMVTTNLPNVTGRFIHKSGNFGDLVEGDYVYMIDQRYSLVNSTPFKQLVLYTVNKIVYRQYTAGILSASYVTYTSRNKPTKSDVGLSAVVNERQYSMNNPPPGLWKRLWVGATSMYNSTATYNFPSSGISSDSNVFLVNFELIDVNALYNSMSLMIFAKAAASNIRERAYIPFFYLTKRTTSMVPEDINVESLSFWQSSSSNICMNTTKSCTIKEIYQLIP